MTVSAWRIAVDTPQCTSDDLGGEGARVAGGRWNRQGTAMLYAAGSIALACLESVVHLGLDDLPLNRYLVAVDIPDDLWAGATMLETSRHVGWDAIPAGRVSIDFGTRWAASQISPVLRVPSVIVPEETHVLLNPAHPASRRITARKLRRWLYDARL